MLLVNYRPEYRHPWGSRPYYRELSLAPLPPERAEELARVLVGDASALAPLRRLLIERILRRTGESRTAREHLATAAAMYREMGMTYWLERVEAGLAEPGVEGGSRSD